MLVGGFRAERSVDTAILRMLRAVSEGCRYIAVLDFRQAYVSVPRSDLAQKLRTLLDSDLSAMVECMLLDTYVRTIGDLTNTVGTLQRGLPERSPLSRCLFNMFINPLAELVYSELQSEWRIPINRIR